ncbi:AAA family ATPase [Kocuria rosea]|uniref:AAA family ATPase n=1 Tax=Kocuria rosea TaxID=1275 RepID=UPI002041D4B7|nr:AAA family ATPase [Kocuria rosea]MCM3687691.1 AAA family ATPase [Kocuria rosea]
MTAQEATERLLLTPASMITPRRQKWFWAPGDAGVIPLGTGTICAGKGGEGKTTFMLDLAAQLTRGELPGDLYGTRGTVIILGPEDDWDSIMVPRLLAAGADLDHVYAIEVETVTDTLAMRRELRFPLDSVQLEIAMSETGARLVLVDPAPALMYGDMNKVQDVRAAYGPLMALAQKYQAAMVLINHFGKAAGSVSNRLSGSHAWRDVTRSYLAFATDEQSGERILSQDKNNYGTGSGSYRFALESVDVPTSDGPTSVARVRFLGESEVTVAELLHREGHREDAGDDRDIYERFIIEYLSEEGGTAPAAEVQKAAAAAGFNVKTLQRRRKEMKNPEVTTGRSGYGKGAKYVWAIKVPVVAPMDPTDSSMDPMDSRAWHEGIHGIHEESMGERNLEGPLRQEQGVTR